MGLTRVWAGSGLGQGWVRAGVGGLNLACTSGNLTPGQVTDTSEWDQQLPASCDSVWLVITYFAIFRVQGTRPQGAPWLGETKEKNMCGSGRMHKH